MRVGTRVYRLGAVLPGVVLSAAVVLVIVDSLPATPGGMLLVGYVGAAAVLACGWLEVLAVLGLSHARRPTVGEEQLLQDLAGWLRARGLSAPHLYVARSDVGRAAAEPWGRRSVVVAPRVMHWLHRGLMPQASGAAVVAQAVARLQVGPSRYDLAVRLLTLPGALILAGFVRIAGWFAWMPGVMALWRIRAILGIVAVWECLQSNQVTIAVTTGSLMTVSYSAPACARAWRRRVEIDADQLVVSAGLADQLEFAVRSADEHGFLDRVQRIRAAAMRTDGTTCSSMATNRQLYVVRR
jgi:hypothetical protein